MAREQAGLSQLGLSEILDVSLTSVQNWESARGKPSRDRLVQIASALNQPVSWFFGESEESAAPKPVKQVQKPRARPKADPTPEDRLGRLESVLGRLVDELAATREELRASREESKAARLATKALRKRLAATEAALAAPDLPSQAGASPQQLRSTGSG